MKNEIVWFEQKTKKIESLLRNNSVEMERGKAETIQGHHIFDVQCTNALKKI